MSHRKAHIYVMPYLVDGRPTSPHTKNSAWTLCEEFYFLLPPDMREAFRRLLVAEEERKDRHRAWARGVLDDFRAGRDVPVDDDGEGSKARAVERVTALWVVWDAGRRGVTISEARHRTGKVGNGLSGALSDLHAAGVIERLEQQR